VPARGLTRADRYRPSLRKTPMHLSPELVDTVADYMAVFVLLFVPGLLIYIFWMVHILPEKIAERRGHPQADAIKTLCLLSLVFGGLLWPIAWLWAYSKPVFHKMAYGTDRVDHSPAEHQETAPTAPTGDAHSTVGHAAARTETELVPAGSLSGK
jgi:hypothetical protein